MILGDVIPYNRIKKENFKAKVYTYTLRLCVLKNVELGFVSVFLWDIHLLKHYLIKKTNDRDSKHQKCLAVSNLALFNDTKNQPRTDSSWQGRVRTTHSQGGLGADHRLILPIKCLTLETLARVTNRVDIPETIPSPNGVAIQYLGTARLLYIICPG